MLPPPTSAPLISTGGFQEGPNPGPRGTGTACADSPVGPLLCTHGGSDGQRGMAFWGLPRGNVPGSVMTAVPLPSLQITHGSPVPPLKEAKPRGLHSKPRQSGLMSVHLAPHRSPGWRYHHPSTPSLRSERPPSLLSTPT